MAQSRRECILVLTATLLTFTMAGCGGGGATGDPPPPVALVEIGQSGVFLTSLKQRRVLTVRITSDQGDELHPDVLWKSSNPSEIAVSTNGTVSALVANGSSQITATAGGVSSSPVLAVVTETSPGTLVVGDSQILSDPTPVDPSVPFGAGVLFTIRLGGVEPPTPGTIVVSSESKALAGRVVSSNASGANVDVTLEVVPLTVALPNLVIDQSLPMDKAKLALDLAALQEFDVINGADGTVTFNAKPIAALSVNAPEGSPRNSAQSERIASALVVSAQDHCKIEAGSPLDLKFLELKFTVKPKVDVLEIKWTPSVKRVVVTGSADVTEKVSVEIAVQGSLKVKCDWRLFTIPLPFLPGSLGFLIWQVPVGVGFEGGYTADVAKGGASGELSATIPFSLGFDSSAGSRWIHDFSRTATSYKLAPVWEPLSNANVELATRVYASAKLSYGLTPALGSKWNTPVIDLLSAKIGPKLEEVLAPVGVQSLKPDNVSKYRAELSLSTRVSAEVVETAFKLISVSFPKLEIEILNELARSPTGTLFSDKTFAAAGDTVLFTVSFDVANLEWPLYGHNVDGVDLYLRQDPLLPDVLVKIGEAPVALGAHDVVIPVVASSDWSGLEVFAFVRPRFLYVPPVTFLLGSFSFPAVLRLELAPTSATVDVNSSRTFVAKAFGPNNAPVPLPSPLIWTSSNPAVATVTDTGVAMGVAPGSATIHVIDPVTLASASAELLVQQAPPPSARFTFTGNLRFARQSHTATVLPTGKVLIAGGGDMVSLVAPAELYDPGAGTFSTTGSLGLARQGHTATLLRNGTVLIAGGVDFAGAVAADSAELYDPASGTFTPTGPMTAGRGFHSATLLASGKVLVAGGYPQASGASAELYDPATKTFTATGSMSGLHGEGATLLSNGQVFVAGHIGSGGGSATPSELYDPSTGTFLLAGASAPGISALAAVRLASGQVLLAGIGAERFDPISQSYIPVSTLANWNTGTMTLLPSGAVLFAAGNSFSPGGTFAGNPIEAGLYDPTTDVFTVIGNMRTGRVMPTATLLVDGSVLIAGGVDLNDTVVFASAELFK